MEDVRSIMGDIAELSETTAQEVDRQENLVIAIEENVDDANENVVAANVQLSQSSARKERRTTRTICILLVLFLVMSSWLYATFGNPFTSSDPTTTQINENMLADAVRKAVELTMELPPVQFIANSRINNQKLANKTETPV